MIGVVIRDNSDKAHVNGSAHLLHWGPAIVPIKRPAARF